MTDRDDYDDEDLPEDPFPDAGDELDDPPIVPNPDRIGIEEESGRDFDPDDINRDTDRRNAMDFHLTNGNDFIWTPENGWFVWDGRRWAPDDGLVRRNRCGALADLFWKQFDDSGDEVYARRARRMESVAGMNGCLLFCEEMFKRSILDFDKNTDLFNCTNGTIELRTGNLRGFRREDMITRMCPTPFDPTASDVVWNQVLWDAFGGDVSQEDYLHMARYLGRFAGYSLTGDTLEKSILVVNGPANSGKSTVTEALYKTVGDVAEGGYASTWPADMIQAGTQVNRDYLMDKARGSRMIIVAELERGSRMADSFVKQVSGGDMMNHRRVYSAPYDHRPTAKLIMHSNYVPRSTDNAVHARLKLLPFEHPAKRTAPGIISFLNDTYGVHATGGPDPRVRHHLETSMGARKAILAWAVNGAKMWYREGMSPAPWMKSAMEKYIVESDHVWAFVQDELVEIQYIERPGGSLADPNLADSVHVERAWVLYQGWAIENVARPLKRRSFEAALEERGIKKGRWPARSGKKVWLGWREVSNDERLGSL